MKTFEINLTTLTADRLDYLARTLDLSESDVVILALNQYYRDVNRSRRQPDKPIEHAEDEHNYQAMIAESLKERRE